FVEEDHIGLKAKFEANSPTPAQVTLGYYRGVLAVVPQQSRVPSDRTEPLTVQINEDKTDNTKKMVIEHDPDELMSLYTTFCANIGFGDPVEIHHFLATGTAAITLLSDRNRVHNLQEGLDKSACGAPPSDSGGGGSSGSGDDSGSGGNGG